MTRRNQGFTVIEYIVILAICGVLAAILFPAFARTHCNDRRESCQSNLKQIALGFAQYTADYDGRYPSAGVISSSVDRGWVRRLQPYTHSLSVFRCPSASASFRPQDRPHSPFVTDYYFNRQLSFARYKKLRFPARTILLGDGESASSDYSCSSFDFCTGTGYNGTLARVPEEANTRHINGANYAFVDGHVKYLKPDKITVSGGDAGQYRFGNY